MNAAVLTRFTHIHNSNKKALAVLIDPDKLPAAEFWRVLAQSGVDFIFIGGSFLSSHHFEKAVETIKKNTNKPLIIFPGSTHQITERAEAILLLSLISGRNADLLIGKHVESAFQLKNSGLEIVSTGYLLFDSGKMTTAHYITNTNALPMNKPELAAATALAGDQLGLSIFFLDAGSGASTPVHPACISAVRSITTKPLLVGGGINSPTLALSAWNAGADIVVIGNAVELDLSLLQSIDDAREMLAC